VVVRLGCDSDRMTVAPRYAENEEGDFDNRLCSDVYPMQPSGGHREGGGDYTFLSATI
jgi:hypothetical protein